MNFREIFGRRVFGRRKEDAELAQELDSHLQHEIDDNMARGMNPDEARWLAHVKLGNRLRIRDQVWEANRLAWIEDLWRDLRYAARTLMRAPSFTCVALLVMALGIGANTSIYSFLDSLLLRALPVADPASLVVIEWHAETWRETVIESMHGHTDDDSKLGVVGGIFPYGALEVFRSSTVFSDVFAYAHTRTVDTMNVSIKGQAEVAGGELVSGDYFNGLRIVPAAGRLISPDDDRVGAAAVVSVSYAYSEQHFGGADAAVGQNVLIDNQPFTIVGVAPP
jgi:macrolide transport system ATP-binding/permease protein